MHRLFVALTVLLGSAWSAQGQEPPPAWAYVVNPPDFKSAPDEGKPHRVPDSDVVYSTAQLHDRFSAPDWHPADHPVMPEIVAHGRKDDVSACGFCHRADGPGGPENANLAGLPADYIVQQMADYRNGVRGSSVAKRPPTDRMMALAKAVTDDEARQAAAYFSALKPRAAIKVVEADMVPKTVVAGWFLADAGTGEREPIGGRIIEIPEDPALYNNRDSHARFIAYVPLGSIEKGRHLAGGAGETEPCRSCHGGELKGAGDVPGIAGRSPGYLMRQMYDIKHGARAGSGNASMKAIVDRLSTDDMLALAAYAATLTP